MIFFMNFKIIIVGFMVIILVSCKCKQDKEKVINVVEVSSNSYSDDLANVFLLDASKDSLNVFEGVFGIPELQVVSSPDDESHYMFSKMEKIIAYDVSPAGIIVAVLVEKDDKNCIMFWQLGKNILSDSCLLPEKFKANAIAWHPQANALFVMGSDKGNHRILRIEKISDQWILYNIFSSQDQLSRLAVCPRPFITEYDYKTKLHYYHYRLFFGMNNGDKSYRIVSVTEFGKRFYQVVGPSKTFTSGLELDEDGDPSHIEADHALPIAFHPAGHQLIWEGKNNKYFIANYDFRSWGKSESFNIGINNLGTITPAPNGLGVINWQKSKPGLGIYLFSTGKEEIQLSKTQFVSNPLPVPDGRGVVGTTILNGLPTLKYAPIKFPLADITNAWMFAESFEEIDKFQRHSGLFRLNNSDQLYKLYETESYYCNSFDRRAPTRPYLVTTDIFWELFGAAYQGLFIVRERDEAIPNFWQFVKQSEKHLKNQNSNSPWSRVFSVLAELHSGDDHDQEVIRIKDGKDCYTDVINDVYQYSELKSRGHYTSSPEMENYFKAFKYLTTIFLGRQDTLYELNSLPKEVLSYANNWIATYSGFISPSKSPLVITGIKQSVPVYCQYPEKDPAVFPLSWGFDNEVFFSTVYQRRIPQEYRVEGPSGPRIFPSGVDMAAVFGNSLAEKILQSDYEKYPPLSKVINNLKGNFAANSGKPDIKENLYNHWINAVAIQWADTVTSPHGDNDKEIWQAKRLQTGLASWATLRHATVLVNQRVAAECGEGGFEEIIMRAPRGYVEPDPYTFGIIAELFDNAIKIASNSILPNDVSGNEKRALYEGIIKRLEEAGREARSFQIMAEKVRRWEELDNDENEKILFVARTAEHLFLIFNSLSNKEYSLSNPDPIAKITDVAGGGIFPYVMAAVGNTMEWNHIVPFYGRRQIVKGSIYSYYEFISDNLMDDDEWRNIVATQEVLPWLKPFVTDRQISGMAKTYY
jgi:hypothetical protein